MHAPKVFVDANCLHKLYLRNLFLTLANNQLIEIRWSYEVLAEVVVSLERRYPDSALLIRRNILKLSDSFPDALVKGFEDLIGSLGCRDPEDEHVLAAAVRSRVDFLATFNLKDFPKSFRGDHELKVLHPDELLTSLAAVSPVEFFIAVATWVDYFQNPPLSIEESAETLIRAGCPNTAKILLDNTKLIDKFR